MRGENLPWDSSTFHIVRQGYVIAPNVELPFSKTKNPTVNPAGMDSHSHIYVHCAHLSVQSEKSVTIATKNNC